MDNAEAIGILRGTTSPASALHPQIAADLGADALAAWEWVEKRKALVSRNHGQWFCAVDLDRYANGPTPLSAVLDAMRNEETDGR